MDLKIQIYMIDNKGNHLYLKSSQSSPLYFTKKPTTWYFRTINNGLTGIIRDELGNILDTNTEYSNDIIMCPKLNKKNQIFSLRDDATIYYNSKKLSTNNIQESNLKIGFNYQISLSWDIDRDIDEKENGEFNFIMSTYNILLDGYEKETGGDGRNFRDRVQQIATKLNSRNSDIILLQEININMLKQLFHLLDLNNNLDYCIGVKGRSSCNSMECAIIYNKTKFKLLSSIEPLSNRKRCLVVTLKDILFNNILTCVSCHLYAGEKKENENSRLSLMREILSNNQSSDCDNIIIGGDFNSDTRSPNPSEGLYYDPLLDSLLQSKGLVNASGNNITYHGWNALQFDYLYTKGLIKRGETIIDDLRSGPGPNHKQGSDHTPVTCTFAFRESSNSIKTIETLELQDINGTPVIFTKNTEGYSEFGCVYTCESAILVKKQQIKLPMIIMSQDYFNFLSKYHSPRVKNANGTKVNYITHQDSFGKDVDILNIKKRYIGGYNGFNNIPTVCVWKFPYDLNNNKQLVQPIHIFNIPLPVGTYNLSCDKWVYLNTEFPHSLKTILMNTFYRMGSHHYINKNYSTMSKFHIDFETTNDIKNIHFLQTPDGENRLTCIGSWPWFKSYWGQSIKEQQNVNKFIDELYQRVNIVAFSCHQQHHSIVFYLDTLNNKQPLEITPLKLVDIIENKPKRKKIIIELMTKYTDQPINYFENWMNNYRKFHKIILLKTKTNKD